MRTGMTHERTDRFIWQDDDFELSLDAKFNPHHDRLGRFATGTGAGTGASEHSMPDDITDLRGMEKWMKRRHPDTWISVQKGDMDAESVKPALEELDRQMNAYPEVAARIKYIGGFYEAPESALKDLGMQSSEMGDGVLMTVMNNPIGKQPDFGIFLNEVWFSHPAELQKGLRDNVTLKWHPEGCDNIESLATHEFGHAINFYMLTEGQGRAFMPVVGYDGFGKVGETTTAWMKAHRNEAAAVSGYATEEGPEEAWAEGYAALRWGTSKPAYSQQMDTLLNTVFRDGKMRDVPAKVIGENEFTDAEHEQATASLQSMRQTLGMQRTIDKYTNPIPDSIAGGKSRQTTLREIWAAPIPLDHWEETAPWFKPSTKYIPAKFNPHHDRSTGRFTSGAGSTLLEAVEKHGGFTYQPVSKRMPSKGLALSPYPERAKVLDARSIRADDINNYIKTNTDVLKRPDHYVGGWRDGSTGKVYLDVSIVTQDPKRARLLCEEFRQRAYFDLAKGEEVRVVAEEAAHKAKSEIEYCLITTDPTPEEMDAILAFLSGQKSAEKRRAELKFLAAQAALKMLR